MILSFKQLVFQAAFPLGNRDFKEHDMKKIALALSVTLLSQIALAKGIEISDAYARATVGQKQSGAFVTLKNTDKKDDVLLSASVDKALAEQTELHLGYIENGQAKMREVKDGVLLKAGEITQLKPGSYHIMLLGLKNDLIVDHKFPMKLKFRNGGEQEIEVIIRSMQPTMMHHQH